MPKQVSEPTIIQKVIDWILGLDRRLLIQNGIIFVIFVVFILGFFLPIVAHNKSMSREVKKLKIMIQAGNTRIARIPEMKKQKEIYGTRLKKIREKFFGDQEIDQIIEVISKAANQNRVRITASRPSNKTLDIPPPFNQMYVAASYELMAEGPYHSLGKFINSLETDNKCFLVSDVQIKKNDSTPGYHECMMTLTAFLKRRKGDT